MGAAGEPKEPGLLEQGTVEFNILKAVVSGTDVSITKPSGTDAYNKFRCLNLTSFSANVTEGQNKTEDITGRPVVKTIPAGAECVFSLTNISGYYQASYTYIEIDLVDEMGQNIARISQGKNAPVGKSATWTQNEELGVSCIAVKAYHFSNNARSRFYLSLTVDGEEWLP